MPAAMMQPSTSPLALDSKERLSSSMPKTIPASGVLNAAAMPAAAPASRRPCWYTTVERRPIAPMIEAPTWTVGPSRPIEAPQSSPSIITTTLPNATRSETSASRASGSSICRAAMTWGMPLPCELGKTLRVRNTARPKPSGVTTKAR